VTTPLSPSATLPKIRVTPEGREGVWNAEKESLKAFIRATGWEAIHNFTPTGFAMIGADHDVESVLEDIDRAERLGILTDGQERTNLGHALAIIINNRLECFDIGKITRDDLEIVPETANAIPPPSGNASEGDCFASLRSIANTSSAAPKPTTSEDGIHLEGDANYPSNPGLIMPTSGWIDENGEPAAPSNPKDIIADAREFLARLERGECQNHEWHWESRGKSVPTLDAKSLADALIIAVVALEKCGNAPCGNCGRGEPETHQIVDQALSDIRSISSPNPS
jgi:hypothetical protein